jgi:hypothetical protein
MTLKYPRGRPASIARRRLREKRMERLLPDTITRPAVFCYFSDKIAAYFRAVYGKKMGDKGRNWSYNSFPRHSGRNS